MVIFISGHFILGCEDIQKDKKGMLLSGNEGAAATLFYR